MDKLQMGNEVLNASKCLLKFVKSRKCMHDLFYEGLIFRGCGCNSKAYHHCIQMKCKEMRAKSS